MPAKLASSSELARFKAATSQEDVASLLGVKTTWLLRSLWPSKACPYRTFTIPKRSGGIRTIEVPHWRVKLLQSRLLPFLLACYAPKESVHGFVACRGVVSNAALHVGRPLVLNIDLLDFFPSIHFGRVRGMFTNEPFNFNNEVASTLARICTRPISIEHASLPQGACTSPIVSNLICRRLDNQLARLARRFRCRYSRYADDITFSTRASELPRQILESADEKGRSVLLGSSMLAILKANGFSENPAKSRVQKATDRQVVTGLVVNQRVNVPRKYVRQIRAMVDSWHKDGLTKAEARFHAIDVKNKTRAGGPPSFKEHLAGKLEFLRMIRGRGDVVFTRYALQVSMLSGSTLVVDIEGKAAWDPKFIRPALWIVRGLDSAGNELSQGTAFMLRDIGFVTARHVVDRSKSSVSMGKDSIWTAAVRVLKRIAGRSSNSEELVDAAIVRWELVRGSAPFDRYPITGYRAHSHPPLDIAILQTTARSKARLVLAPYRTVGHAESVLIEGFPQWNSPADHPDHVTQSVRQIKTVSAVTLFSVNANLYGGMSGAPVIDGSGNVIGVVAYGKDGRILANSAVDLQHLDKVIAAVITPLP